MKSSGTCFLISSGCPPSVSQNPGGSWLCMRVMISDFPLRSFLFIFSANNLEEDNKSHDISPTFWAVIIGTVSLTPSVSVSPGLGGGAESSVGSSPDKDFQA